MTLLWYFDPETGAISRVPGGVSRGIHLPAVPDHAVVIEFHPDDDAAPRAWQPPAYPRPDEED